MTRRREDGVATIWALTGIGVLTGLTLLCAAIGHLLVVHRQVQAGADLAALAGANSIRTGGNPCAMAAFVARKNHGRVSTCRVDDASVTVEITVTADLPMGVSREVHAWALAGPAGLLHHPLLQAPGP